MDIQQAKIVCSKLQRKSRDGGVVLRAEVRALGPVRIAAYDADGKVMWDTDHEVRVVFMGGSSGEHSIDLSVSDESRILAHWEGYCALNGMLYPTLGQVVDFPSGSNWQSGGYRTGKVIKMDAKRAVIAYRYKYGKEATATIPFHEIKFDRT